MRIKKVTQTTPTSGTIEDSLESNSTTNAPSVHAVNERLLWKLVNSVVGTETVTLPSNFNEILVLIKEGSSDNVNYSFLIPKLYLSTNAKGFTDGYHTGDTMAKSRIRIMVSTTSVSLTIAMLDTSEDVRSSSTITVYYR